MTTCAMCKYLEPVSADQGLCHRYPPVACIVMAPNQHAISRQIQLQPQSMSALPTVAFDAWCGEFVVAPPKLKLA